jgi:membrane fusion protein, multidrug efflux system
MAQSDPSTDTDRDRRAETGDRKGEEAEAEREPGGRDGESKETGEETKREDEKKEGKDGGKGEGDGKGEEEKGFHPSRKAIVIGALVFLTLVVGGVLYWLHARQFVSTDDAYTTGHVHQISARISGTVVEVNVDDNQLVEAGAVLVRLDPRDYEVSLERAKAGLAQAQADVGNQQAKIDQAGSGISAADAQVEQARAQVSQARAQLEKAQLDYSRIAGLYQQDRKAVSKSDVDAATAALDSARGAAEGAQANVLAAVAQAESSRSNKAAAIAQLKVAQANVGSAQAAEQDAELQLSYCSVISPVRGKVSKKTVETGQRLAPGQALMAIVPEDIWILANLKETQLPGVRPGERVAIHIDSIPNRKFFGTVDSIQEGSGATFSLLPPDNATGNFTKIVQRVPVKIVFDEESIRDFKDRIVPGISVEPRIDLESLKEDKRESKRQKKMEKQNRDVEEGK